MSFCRSIDRPASWGKTAKKTTKGTELFWDTRYCNCKVDCNIFHLSTVRCHVCRNTQKHTQKEQYLLQSFSLVLCVHIKVHHDMTWRRRREEEHPLLIDRSHFWRLPLISIRDCSLCFQSLLSESAKRCCKQRRIRKRWENTKKSVCSSKRVVDMPLVVVQETHNGSQEAWDDAANSWEVTCHSKTRCIWTEGLRKAQFIRLLFSFIL